MNIYGVLGPLLLLAVAAAAMCAANGLDRALRRRVGSRLVRVLLFMVFTGSTSAVIVGDLLSSSWWPVLPLVAAPWALVLLVVGVPMTCRSTRVHGRYA
ncbi:hypothetical protein NLX86_20215 [Streptomyces sp. A3M-1-3]|uniref:hypothetical protein n=1 Tax=Streptomyces sp. A3M-1-3 TaxID=2962044 RepID=UPI0020B7E295|nr:hypothetical protein [Streptomyces sp. A3M-1-3]MCP3820337.1 hypothetical protein [Streptomyces sp. A3M-1-3]